MEKPTNAFILRQSPNGVSQLESISLPQNVIVNGWADAEGLIEEKNYETFREIVAKACYPNEKNMRKAGYGAGTMWRFINEMKKGDWVVVPFHNKVFYLAEITGEAIYDGSDAAYKADSCYRRPVRWLNDKQPISRELAQAKLVSRMKTQQTSAEAGDLIDNIYVALSNAMSTKGAEMSSEELFVSSLRKKMTVAVLDEIHRGYMTPQKMEKLVMKILKAVGASTTKQIPTITDKGVDIIATFPIGPVAQVDVGVQVKCHEGTTENELLDQLKTGLEKENLTQGWFITAGSFSDDAQEYLEDKFEGSGVKISLIDGVQLAAMIIDSGLENIV
jgi:predicted Mrr-cat superfamily restriction endonuclease